MTFFDDLWQQSEAMQRPLLTLRGAIAGAKGYLLARLFAERRVPLLVVTPDARQRDLLYDDIRCFLDGMSVTVSPWQNLADMVCRYEHQVADPCRDHFLPAEPRHLYVPAVMATLAWHSRCRCDEC